MIALNRRTKVFVSKDPADMRASYDTLFKKVKTILDKDPFSGHLFVFMNRTRTSCKCLYFDGTGLVIIAKRLENSRFAKINPCYSGEIILTQAEFTLLFEGADLNKRFIESPTVSRK
ncbi:MAG: IS66 family insertion sequence element accessory protein TnpB [Oligoflexales bacterium]